MPRPLTADVPTRRLLKPEAGAIRSVATTDGAFVISLRSKSGHTAADSWTVLHQPSGALTSVWSFREAIDFVRRLRSYRPASDAERWLILPRSAARGSGTVLFDLLTGRWWPRDPERRPTPDELALMAAAVPVVEYQVGFADAAVPTTLTSGAAGRSVKVSALRRR